jgi:hypothetical protein
MPALLAGALLVAGCGGADRPFDKVALIPSYWEIVRVSGTDLVGATLPILTIGRSNSARVALTCGEIDFQYNADTDGAALSFGEQRVATACETPPDEKDIAVRSAIGAVKGWRVVSDTSIELLDGRGQAVLSLQATTCDCPHQPPGTGQPTSS